MPSPDASTTTEHLRLGVPELAARPFVGAGCCVVGAADVVCDALAGLRGVRSVACDDEQGEVRLELDPGSGAGLLPTVRAILDGIGYPLAEVRS